MKNIYLSLFILLFTKSIVAQQYYPLLDSINSWNYTTNYIPVRLANPTTSQSNCTYPYWFINTMTEFTTGDTTIGSFIYKKVNAVADLNPTLCYFGFVREDTSARKVFFLDNLGNPEITLYDFSMSIGNSLPIIFTQSSYFISGIFTLDSITNYRTSSGWRPAYNLNDHANPLNHSLTWIEGVGNLADAFYPYCNNQMSTGWYWNCQGFPHDNIQFMTCFDHNYKVYYDSCAYVEAVSNGCINTVDTCNYWNICGAINENSSLTSLTIFPNPSNGKINLALDVFEKDNFSIEIYDNTGKKILRSISLGQLFSGKSEIELSLEGLPAGFYLLECRGEKASEFRKLIIEN